MSFKKSFEKFELQGENLLKKIKELIEEGNIRKITIHDKSGKELMSFPLSFGVVGALLAPVLAALIGDCTITVERETEAPADKNINMDTDGQNS